MYDLPKDLYVRGVQTREHELHPLAFGTAFDGIFFRIYILKSSKHSSKIFIIFQINSHVPMIYYEPYYLFILNTFNTKLNYHF
jgi:hypothetical protein